MSFTKMIYPVAAQEELVEDYFGTKVSDPYKWMEDPDCEKTKDFVQAQNSLSFPYLKSNEIQKKFEERMTVVYNYPKYSCTFKKGPRYFYYMNTGLQNQSVLYVQETLDSEAKVFLDPNLFAEDGTISLRNVHFTKDGSLCAYSISKSGSDWTTIKFKNVVTGEELEDTLKRTKFTCMQFTRNNKGFFYNAYLEQEGKTDGTETTSNINQKLLYHVIGTDQSKDVVVAEFPENPKWMSSINITDDNKYLLLSISEGCEHVNQLWYVTMETFSQSDEISKPNWIKLIDNFDAEYSLVTNDGSLFTFQTNLNASKSKLITIDFEKPDKSNWKTLVEEHPKDVLDWSFCVNEDVLVLCYMKDVKNVVELRNLSDGKLIQTLPLPVGSVVGSSGKRDMKEFFLKFTSFLEPGVIYRFNFEDFKLQVLRKIEVKGIDTDKFTTKQVFYPSKDGTKIPMFIIHKKDIELNGNHPTVLYGYGGFNIAISPSFGVSRLLFLRHLEGVFAVANIRGGGEYGESWHKSGTIHNKQNVFDDFQSAANYLVTSKYTKPQKLAINGGSNGGLLVAACINQQPQLFGCAVAQVGVMDMLNFHKFTIGHAWTTDYGCSDDEQQFKTLYKYSPVHNVPKQGQFPALLLLTGDHDDRVVPHHSLKYIATVQRNLGESNKRPLLIRVDTESGHGSGKPTSKIIEEVADMYGFIATSVGAEWKD